MVKASKVCLLFMGAFLIFGCASRDNGGESAENVKAVAGAALPNYKVSFEKEKENDPRTGQKLLKKAKSAIGTPYVFGGTTLDGFDCSGFVKWAYNSVGVQLPRTAQEQSVVGKKIKKIEDMRAGDIVAFRHPRRGYHTGIYVGDGKFIHSPRKRTRVRINSLSDPYFSQTLLGARRVKLDATENLLAQAESRLEKYMTRKNIRHSGGSVTENRGSRKETARESGNSGRKSLKKKASQSSREQLLAKKTGKKQAVAKKTDKKRQTAEKTDKKRQLAEKAARKTGKTVAQAAKPAKNGKRNAASQKPAKLDKKQARSLAHNARPVKSGVHSAKKSASHKAVSMLNAKSHKTARKSRNHS